MKAEKNMTVGKALNAKFITAGCIFPSINEANRKLLPSCEKLNSLFIALSHHENIGFPNGVIRIKIPNNNWRLSPHITILKSIFFLLFDNR